MKKRIFLLALFLLPFVVVLTATQSKGFDESQAKSSSAKDREQSRERRSSRDGSEWFGRGYELHHSDRYEEAIEAFKKAIEYDYRRGTAMYNIACGYALLDDAKQAMQWLEQAIANGFDGSKYLFDDSDLDSLRSLPEFRELLTRVSAASKAKGKPDRFEQTAARFDQLQREASTNGEEWSQVGTRLLRLRELDRAILALTEAVRHLGASKASTLYNLACAYALNGDREVALDWLDKAVEAGFSSDDKFGRDPDFASLKSDARFQRIAQKSRELELWQFQKEDRGEPNEARFSKRRWATTVAHFEAYVQRDSSSGRAWFNLGYALHYSGEHAKARPAFERAVQLGYRKPTTLYNIACTYAMAGDRDAAFEWLEKSLAAGFELVNYLYHDEDLDGLRDDARFRSLYERARAAKREKYK